MNVGPLKGKKKHTMLQRSNLMVTSHNSCRFLVLRNERQEVISVDRKLKSDSGTQEMTTQRKKVGTDVLALSAKGSLLKGGSCSKYSKISAPAELVYSPSSLDEQLKALFLIESPFIPCKADSTRCCCLHTPEQLALLSVSQSLLPALLVSLDDSSLSSPDFL